MTTPTNAKNSAVAESFASYLEDRRRWVEEHLAELLPEAEEFAPSQLGAAIRYACLGNGKRLRPILAMAGCEAVGAASEKALAPAAAVECIHAYSLVHDDLPALDNDDLRRGRATTHRAYDEATAILVGDALQTLAFQAISEAEGLPETARLAMVQRLSRAVGSWGMVGGQALDLAWENGSPDLTALQQTHRMKTGALLTASVELGGLAGEATGEALEALGAYGRHIGLAFQITDDLLDVEGSTESLGKEAGSDIAHSKATYPALMGKEAAKELGAAELERALASLEPLGKPAEPLRSLGRFIVERTH